MMNKKSLISHQTVLKYNGQGLCMFTLHNNTDMYIIILIINYLYHSNLLEYKLLDNFTST